MRPIIRLLAAAVAAAATIPSCSTLTGYPTDAEASYAKAIELTKKSVDTDKFKIYSLSIMEGETLSDNLFLVTVKLVNKDDQAFSQSYYMNGLEPTDLRDVQSTFEAPEYETTAIRRMRTAFWWSRLRRPRLRKCGTGSPPRSPKPKRCFPKDTPTNR